jgi:hypothetical protein
LSLQIGGRSLGGSAGLLSIGSGLTLIPQTITDELRDDGDLLGRSMVEGGPVDGLEGVFLAAVEARTELDGGVGARTEIEALDQGSGIGRYGRGRTQSEEKSLDVLHDEGLYDLEENKYRLREGK